MEKHRILSKFSHSSSRKTHDTSPAFDVERSSLSLSTSNRTIFQPQRYHQSRFSRGSVFSNRGNPPPLAFPFVSHCSPRAISKRAGVIKSEAAQLLEAAADWDLHWFISRHACVRSRLNAEIERVDRWHICSSLTANIPIVCPQQEKRKEGSGYGEKTKGLGEGERFRGAWEATDRDIDGYVAIFSSPTFNLSPPRLRTIGTVNIPLDSRSVHSDSDKGDESFSSRKPRRKK